MVDLLARAVGGNLGAVAGVEEHALVAVGDVVEEPVQALQDVGGGGAIVEDHADLLGLEAALLQHGAHQEHVVDAALEAVRRIRVRVDADEERAALGSGCGARGWSGRRASACAAAGTPRDRTTPGSGVFAWLKYQTGSWFRRSFGLSNGVWISAKFGAWTRSSAVKTWSSGL